MKKLFKVLSVLTAVGMLGACGTMHVSNPTPVDQIPNLSDVEKKYFIQVGDVLRIEIEDVSIAATAEDPGYEIPVRPDGKIFLPYLKNEVDVAGHTTKEVRDELVKQYAKIVKRPNLLVNIIEFSPREVYVMGETRAAPDTIPYSTRLTAMRALATAGYDSKRANLDNIIVVRAQGRGKEALVMSLDIYDAITNRDKKQDIRLMPNDVVVVPKKAIVVANDFIEQWINNMVPVPGFTTGIAGAWVYDRYLDTE